MTVSHLIPGLQRCHTGDGLAGCLAIPAHLSHVKAVVMLAVTSLGQLHSYSYKTLSARPAKAFIRRYTLMVMRTTRLDDIQSP